jgi:hypothetical protein
VNEDICWSEVTLELRQIHAAAFTKEASSFENKDPEQLLQHPPSKDTSARVKTPIHIMADAHLRQEDLKALDQARSRLFQLASNINSLKIDIAQSNPLPEW